MFFFPSFFPLPSRLLLGGEIEEDVFSTDCYSSAISAFPVSRDVAEMSRRELGVGEPGMRRGKGAGRKTSGQQSSVPQTGNVSLRMTQLLCLASAAAVADKSKQHEQLKQQLFKSRPLKIARLHYRSFPTVSVSPVFGLRACFVCAIVPLCFLWRTLYRA